MAPPANTRPTAPLTCKKRRREMSYGESMYMTILPDCVVIRDRSRLEEREQIRIHLVLVGGAEPVWCAGIDFKLCLWRDLHRCLGRGADRDDLVIVAVDEERRHG